MAPDPPARHLPAAPGTPLYVHLPFCVHLCPYCDFFSVEGAGADIDGTIATLLDEANCRAPAAPATVFVGGGTPSYLDETQLRRVFDGLEEATGFRGSATEVTVECNPESLTPGKATLLRELGVDRLSIGIQSLDPATLAFYERPHDAAQALAAVATARAAGFERVSVDVIHGAPTEPLDSIERNLLQIISLGPDHVSAYGLTYEPGTPLHARMERGEVEPLDEDDELARLELVDQLLRDGGLHRYEVSNYSIKGQQCEHNVNYWRNGPYIGLGPSAASHVGGRRSTNPRSLARWAAARAEHPLAAGAAEELDPRERLGETWWLGLRLTEGVDPAAARATAGWPPAPPGASGTPAGSADGAHSPGAPSPGPKQPDLTDARPTDDPAEDLARELVAEGLLEQAAGRYRLTEGARPLADHVGRRFLA